MRLSDITRRFRSVLNLLEGPIGPDARPVEVRAAVVDAIEGRVETIGVGRRVFPYQRIAVRLLTPETGDKAPLERVFADLAGRVRERLREVRCDAPHDLVCRLVFVKHAPPGWAPDQLFSIDYGTRDDGQTSEASSAIPPIRLIVLKGAATKKSYAFTEPTILLGRTPEVGDDQGRIRRNHVAFDDGESTVSRAHARLTYDKVRREYRLVDNGSARGTRVVRGGATIPVLRDPRGVRVRSGDEIQLGDVSVRVVIG